MPPSKRKVANAANSGLSSVKAVKSRREAAAAAETAAAAAADDVLVDVVWSQAEDAALCALIIEEGIWEASYDGSGDWSDALCADAIKAALGGDYPTPLDDEDEEMDGDAAGYA